MDEKTVMAALNGDSAAFEELYKRTYPRAHAIALGVVKDEFEAFDIVQEAYVTLLEKGSTLEDPQKLESWFVRIVRNTAIDFVRRKKPTLFTDMEGDEGSDTAFEDTLTSQYDSFDPEKVADYAETKRIMQELIDQLPEKQRICVMLRWKEDKKISEIAAITGYSEATVKSCLRYGHEKLAKGVKDLEKKGTKLYGIAPLALIPFLRWMLGGQAPAQAVTATASAGVATTVAVGGAAAAGGSAAAATGISFAVKLAAGVLAAVLAVGGTLGIVQLAKSDEAPQTQPETTLASQATPAERPDVYTTTFGDTIVLTPQPITEFEGEAPDEPSRVLDVSKNIILETGAAYVAQDSPQHCIGTVPVTRVVIPEALPNANPAYWFSGLADVVSVEGLENIDTATAYSLDYMFYNCKSLQRVEGIAHWDVTNVTTVNYTFCGCESLVYVEDLSSWRPNMMLQMQSMFEGCRMLGSVSGFASWDLSQTTDMCHMFRSCSALTYVGGLENLGNAYGAMHICMLQGTAVSPLPLWYIEYETGGVDRPEGDLRDPGCFTDESLRILHQAYPQMPALEGYPWPEPVAEPTEPENIGATDNPTGYDPEEATEPTEFVGMYDPDEEQTEDIFIGMYPADE